MKLYYKRGTCALATHIALLEIGVPFETEKVDLATKKTASGGDYYAVSPNGYVPALEFDGQVLTEIVSVLLYIADLKPEARLAPPKDAFERYRLLQWLGFINSEVHKTYTAYFAPGATDAEKQRASEKLAKRIDFVERSLGDRPYLLGEQFTVADCYLYTVLGWASVAKLNLARWPKVQAYFQRIDQRPAVRKAHEDEKAAA